MWYYLPVSNLTLPSPLTHNDVIALAKQIAGKLYYRMPEYSKASVTFEDFVQEALIAGYKAASKYNPNHQKNAQPSTYVYHCMQNHLRSVLTYYGRQRRHHVSTPIADAQQDIPDESFEGMGKLREVLEKFLYILESVSPQARALFILLALATNKSDVTQYIRHDDCLDEIRAEASRWGLTFEDFLSIFRNYRIKRRLITVFRNNKDFVSQPAKQRGIPEETGERCA